MNEPNSVRRFEYRQPRMGIGFNVDFVTERETIHGFCKDVSEAGVRAELEGSVATGSSGLLILRHPDGVVTLNARVAYVENFQVGLIFHFQTPWERRLTSEFIASITNDTGTSLVVQLP